MKKEIYINDLLLRFPGYTFTETVKGDLVTVTFEDQLQFIHSAFTNLRVIDAYRRIRRDMLEGEEPTFLSSTSDLDKLKDIDQGFLIYNIVKNRNEVFNGSKWRNSAGAAIPAYGEMFENNPKGTLIEAIASIYTGWTTAKAGELDQEDGVTFEKNETADRLVTGDSGEGAYEVAFESAFTGTATSGITATIHVNDVPSSVHLEIQGRIQQKRVLVKSGFLNLADNDFIDLRFLSAGAYSFKIFQTKVSMHRISIRETS